LVSTFSRHLVGGGAAIDDDGLAVGAEPDGCFRDGALGVDVERLADVEGAGRKRDDIALRIGGLGQGLEPTMHPDRDALLGEACKIPPHRRFRGAGGAARVRDAHQRTLAQQRLDDLPAFPLVHVDHPPFARKLVMLSAVGQLQTFKTDQYRAASIILRRDIAHP
jgi:hypothetical protein